MNVEADMRDLKRCVSEIERSFGFLTQQIKSVHKDLLAFQVKTKQKFEQIDGRLEKIDGRVEKLDGRLDLVERGVRGLRMNVPKIVSSAMREVLGGKPRKK
jgi:archaellum component FlaC